MVAELYDRLEEVEIPMLPEFALVVVAATPA
jgi:hypothetical protein